MAARAHVRYARFYDRRAYRRYAGVITPALLIGLALTLAALFARTPARASAPAPAQAPAYALARVNVDGHLHLAYLANKALTEDELRRGALVHHGDVLVVQVLPSENGPAACWVFAGAEADPILADSSGEDGMATCVVRFP